MLEREVSGGRAGTSSRIRNVLGFTWGISGHEFAYRACEQAWLFGANMIFAQAGGAAGSCGPEHGCGSPTATRSRHGPSFSRPGMTWRRLGIPNLEALIGTGVFYGAAGSEARAMRGQHVCMVGAGNSAGQAAVHLAAVRGLGDDARFGLLARTSMSEYLITEIEQTPNISVRLGVESSMARARSASKPSPCGTGLLARRKNPDVGPVRDDRSGTRTDWLEGAWSATSRATS